MTFSKDSSKQVTTVVKQVKTAVQQATTKAEIAELVF